MRSWYLPLLAVLLCCTARSQKTSKAKEDEAVEWLTSLYKKEIGVTESSILNRFDAGSGAVNLSPSKTNKSKSCRTENNEEGICTKASNCNKEPKKLDTTANFILRDRYPVLVDRSVRRAIIVDITIPHDDNLVKAEKEKVSKYLDLAHEITAMWNVESTVIVPIVVSVNGLLAKSFDQHLKKLSLGCWIKGRIQKAVVLETARIVRRFLTLEP
ncbi:jg832 [Pararge aegeria aegeria]|uniref:Jg832 protein n=1 Tax=Pararge aegeria aegeria TaxID=348720 RepID=A0A8S4QMN9_9NEOP|nr:jg832 [Pararge aegeria aegeria]